jgi:Reverse transcriptase (RNA-dependent DNA polymerase)
MANELTALAINATWDLVPLPPNANVVGCKWLFKIKKRADGTIKRYKARLVAKRYTQEEGIDYFDIFSSMIKPTIVRIVLTIALSRN